MMSRTRMSRFDFETNLFVLIVISIVTLVLETTIARLYVFLYPGPQSFQLNIILFAAGIIIFLFSHLIILVYIRKRLKNLFGDSPHRLKFLFRFVAIIQFVLSGLLILALFQILVDSSYKTSLIMSVVIISYLSGIINLSILAERFVRWILRNRSYVSLLFGFATFSILINTIFTVVFVIGVLSTQPDEIERHIGLLPAILSDFYQTYAPLYSISFIISYLVTWFATVTVLYSHSNRLGRARFWALALLPLLYIVGEFHPLILPVLAQYRISDPVTFTIIYTLIFSLIRIAGAIFFGIGFWSMAGKIQQKSLEFF